LSAAQKKNFMQTMGQGLFRGAIGSCPLEHLQMPCCTTVGHIVPGAAVGACPLQYRQMSFSCCKGTGGLVPGAAVGACPLQHLQVTSYCCAGTGCLVPALGTGHKADVGRFLHFRPIDLSLSGSGALFLRPHDENITNHFYIDIYILIKKLTSNNKHTIDQ
jgi:hypothetical protein